MNKSMGGGAEVTKIREKFDVVLRDESVEEKEARIREGHRH